MSESGDSMDSSATGEETYSIGELAEEFGITSRTLRLYEEEGLLDPRREGMWLQIRQGIVEAREPQKP